LEKEGKRPISSVRYSEKTINSKVTTTRGNPKGRNKEKTILILRRGQRKKNIAVNET